jgi:hypothetical protein
MFEMSYCGFLCSVYQYAYDFEWDRAYVYCYDWPAYDGLSSLLLRCTYMLVFSRKSWSECMSITEIYDVQTCMV